MRKLLLISVAAISMQSCADFRDYTAPEKPAGLEQTDLTDADTQRFKQAQEPVATWWKEFDDPQLAELVDQSLKTNLDVRFALANLSEARAVARQAGFDRFPTITASTSYEGQLNSQATPSGSFTARKQNDFRGGFDAVWELDFLGRVSEQIDSQEALADAAIADLENVYVSVTAEVARTYIDLRGTQFRLNIAERNAANQQKTYNLTKQLLDGGRGTALDVSRAATQLDITRANIPSLKAEVTASINALSVLTGQVPDALRESLQISKPLPSLPESIAVGSIEDLLKRRPDIRAAERELAASVAQYNVNVTNLFPTVSLTGSLGFVSSIFSNIGTSAVAGTIGPTISWRAFDLGRVYAEIDQADAKSRQALVTYEKTVLYALKETQTSLSDFSREDERRVILHKAAKSAHKSADIARQRFDQGVDGFLDVLDAERTLLEAEDTLAISEANTALNLIRIYKALGGGWQIVAKDKDRKNIADKKIVDGAIAFNKNHHSAV